MYAALLFYFIVGARRLYRKSHYLRSEHLPFISVVVPLRNEGASAEQTLRALEAQDYKGPWEVICINDRSEDNTPELVESFCSRLPHFKSGHIPQDAPVVPSPKKRALEAGFKMAGGEIFITTDGDCVPPEIWLSSMAENFTEHIGIVQGPKTIAQEHNLITRYQKLETFSFVSIEATTFALGKPMLASAPSLAYRASLFREAGGFSGIEHLVSGDDDMMVHKMTRLPGGDVRYNLNNNACVVTQPVTRWSDLLFQHARWASNGSKYQDKRFVLLLLCLFAFFCWLVVGPVLVFISPVPAWLVLIPLAVKLLLDRTFLSLTAAKFGQKPLLRYFWWAEFLHIPIVVFAAIFGHLGTFRWKK